MQTTHRPSPKHVTAALALAAIALAPGSAGADGEEARSAQATANPCLGPLRAQLRCPDLQMAPPYDLSLDRGTRRGRTLLRAANSIDSLGTGPAELRGRRSGKLTMRARQQIVRRGGGRLTVATGARLEFKFIPGQGRYWKYRHAARFELWHLDAARQRTSLARTGPKQVYCLRDLFRTHPARYSPGRRVYPGCNRSGRTSAVTLGTSVGWSDVYPASYHENWVDVTGLTGTFALVHIADPRNGIWESNEDNNSAETVLRITSGGRLQVLSRTRRGGGYGY